MLAHLWHVGADKGIAVVNKNHKTFYEFMYMVHIRTTGSLNSAEKSFSAEFNDPVVLMCLECDPLFEYLSSPESDNGTADSYLRDFLLFKNPYIRPVARWAREAKSVFERQKIQERLSREVKQSLVASILDEMHGESQTHKEPTRS